MRLIALLIALLLVGLLIYQQMGIDTGGEAAGIPGGQNTDAPKVPENIEQTKQFGAKVNDYVNNEAAKRNREIDKAAGQ